jgi:hypothetical protein
MKHVSINVVKTPFVKDSAWQTMIPPSIHQRSQGPDYNSTRTYIETEYLETSEMALSKLNYDFPADSTGNNPSYRQCRENPGRKLAPCLEYLETCCHYLNSSKMYN